MRNPDRIDHVLNEITKVWHKNPDLRFAQLVLNLDINYNTEEDTLLEKLDKVYNGRHYEEVGKDS